LQVRLVSFTFAGKMRFQFKGFLGALVFVGVVVASLLAYKQLIYKRPLTAFENDTHPCVLGLIRENNLPRGPCPLVGVFYRLFDTFPKNAFEKHAKDKRVVMITWEPYRVMASEPSMLAEIAEGAHDAVIRAFAEDVKEYGDPILLRFAHEMNGNWYSWAGFYNECSPLDFKKAYRRIVSIFREVGTTNVAFIFSPNCKDVPDKRWNHFEHYYPGDDVVDVIGVDVYNFGSSFVNGHLSIWQSAKDLIGPIYERIVKAFPKKPIFLTEVGCSPIGGDKALWMEDMFEKLESRFRAVKAIFWFDINKEQNWSIWHDSSLSNIYRESTLNPHFSDQYADLLWVFQKCYEKDSPH